MGSNGSGYQRSKVLQATLHAKKMYISDKDVKMLRLAIEKLDKYHYGEWQDKFLDKLDNRRARINRAIKKHSKTEKVD